MPVPVEVAKETIHEGFLSEQKYGKFAKRWVVLEKCNTTGCMFLSVYRFSEDGSNPVAENFKHQYILSEYEFIGSIKGRLSSSRNSSFYWAIILKSEILHFQNKSLFVCENWNSKMRENTNFCNWEVRTRSGFKSVNQEAILYLTDHLLAVCYTDLSKVLCTTRLENILLSYSDGCRVSFRSLENGDASTYEVEAIRRSQAARIVEEVQVRKSRRKENQDPDGDVSNAQPVPVARSRKESFQVDENYVIENISSPTKRPLLTPPSTPRSLSPHMGSSPSVSPCPSPTLKKASSPVSVPRSQSLFSSDTKKFGNKLRVPGEHQWKRKNAVRRHRGSTAPNIMLSLPTEMPSDSNPPAVPERPAWTLRDADRHLSFEQNEQESIGDSFSFRHTPLRTMKSVGCAVCVNVCSCEIIGPVLPRPISRPQENNSDTSSISSLSGYRDDVFQDFSQVCTTPPLSPNRSPLKLVRTRSRSLSPRTDGERSFSGGNVPPPVPEHGPVCHRKTDTGSANKLQNSKESITSKPKIPERPDDMQSFATDAHRQEERRGHFAKSDPHRPYQRTSSHDQGHFSTAERPPELPRRAESLACIQERPSFQRTCVVCKGSCECNQKKEYLMSLMDFDKIEEESPYISMHGNGDPYLSMKDKTDLYNPSIDLAGIEEVKCPEDSLQSLNEFNIRNRPVAKARERRSPVPAPRHAPKPAPRQRKSYNNQFLKSNSSNKGLPSCNTGKHNVDFLMTNLQPQSSKKEFTKSFDDLYQLVNQDCQESKKSVENRNPKSWHGKGAYSPYVNLNGGRVKYSRMGSENRSSVSERTLFQLLFEYISKKSVPVDNLNMKPSVWTHFIISFDCEHCENELKDWRGLAELMGLSASDMKIVEEQCRKASRISSEFIMMYWANSQTPFLPYTRQNLLDVLQNLDRMDLIDIIQNTTHFDNWAPG